MNKVFLLFLPCLILFFLPQPTSAANIVVSQEGVAPLYVNFYDAHVEASDGIGSEPFHDREYVWNFGDPDSGAWGTDGKSKNTAKGAVAAHVYDKAGVYTVTLEIYDATGLIERDTATVSVTDPDEVYSGTLSTCVNTSADPDFSGCPIGANQIQTDDIASLTNYADAGERILFKRGSTWNVPTQPNWPNNGGPVSFGAYGDCIDPDDYGICANAPELIVPNNFYEMSHNQNYRIYDLRFVGSMGGGSMDMQRALFYRLDMEDAPGTSIGWSHWNDSTPITIDQMAIVNCRILDSADHALYVGGERIAIMGNHFDDSGSSHLVRVWQAYRSVIQHNIHSHTNMDNSNGRLALKLHSPGYRPAGTWGGETLELCPMTQAGGCLENSTQFTIVSDNLYGGTAYMTSIGAQDTVTDIEASDVIFERNRIVPSFDPGNTTTALGLLLGADYITVRNNIFDMSGARQHINAMNMEDGAGENKTGIKIYNNSMYRDDASNDWNKLVVVGSKYENSIIRNNLLYMPNVTGPVVLVDDSGVGTLSSNNLRISDNPFVDIDSSVLLRDFSLQPTATEAIDQGYTVPVFEDYLGNTRSGSYDLGAYSFKNGTSGIDIRGDVNSDSIINTVDSSLTLRFSLALNMIETSWQNSASTGDVDCSGTTNSIDALLLLRYSLGLDMNGTNWCDIVD